MKNIPIILFALLLFSAAAFAEVAASVNYEQDGFFVQRILQESKQGKISFTTDTAVITTTTDVKLYVKNIGQFGRAGVKIVEDLSYLPSGAKIDFLQAPSETDGRTASWDIGSLGAGEEYSVSFRVPLEVNKEAFKLLASPQITAKAVEVSIAAPASVEKGSAVELSLTASDGTRVPGAKIAVSAPSGISSQVTTDAEGKASFKAEEAGFYTYSVIGYNLVSIAATESVSAKVETPSAGAAIPSKPFDFLGAISSALPFIAGIVLVAAIGLMAFNYAQATSESKQAPPQPQGPPSSYSTPGQSFSYTYAPGSPSSASKEEQPASPVPSAEEFQRKREATRALLERRKGEMVKPEAPADEMIGEEAVEFSPSASRSEDIEKTIKELEALKAKLKKKKSKSGRK
jgi:hypothetical protein